MAPDKPKGAPATRAPLGTTHTAQPPASDSQRLARDRVKAQADHTRICRWLHQLAPLTVHYGPRRWAA